MENFYSDRRWNLRSELEEIGELIIPDSEKQLQNLIEEMNFQDPDYEAGWEKKHPEMWSTDDIINWIYSMAILLDMPLGKVSAERFQDVDGQQLCLMSTDDFIARDQINGAQLNACLAELLRHSQFIPPENEEDCNIYDFDLQKLELDFIDVSQSPTQVIPSFSTFLNPIAATFPFGCLDSLEDTTLHQMENDFLLNFQDPGYESGESSESAATLIPLTVRDETWLDSSPFPCMDTDDNHHQSHGVTSHVVLPQCPVSLKAPVASSPSSPVAGATVGEPIPLKRKRGRPAKRSLSSISSSSSYSSSSSSSDECHSPLPVKKSKTKTTHLWKFMRSLLEDPEYNPSSIKWENRKDGVFRIVPGQSKVIAKLWGLRKNNPSMTFDKLSRSLRWCRTYGFLSEVPKNRNYPKKLCFRFGERAADWEM